MSHVSASREVSEACSRFPGVKNELETPEKGVISALRKIVWRSPGGKLSAATLCSQLYKECGDNTKDLIAMHKGLKGFLAKFTTDVEFVPDQAISFASDRDRPKF